jgi:hypothetical protein
MTYIITYDLNSPGQNYPALHEAIKSFGTWAKPLESTWLVETDLTAQGISARLRPYMDGNDSLLVIGVTRDYQGHLATSIWDWLRARTFRC